MRSCLYTCYSLVVARILFESKLFFRTALETTEDVPAYRFLLDISNRGIRYLNAVNAAEEVGHQYLKNRKEETLYPSPQLQSWTKVLGAVMPAVFTIFCNFCVPS